jgi:hypothetical protein
VEKSPVRDSDAPIVIGVVFAELLALALGLVLVLLLLLLLLLPLLLQAARTPTESATALSAMAFLENQGRDALTPGSSFPPGG